jgi:hypothetical protein
MTPRTGRPRELEGSQRMTFYLDAETAEYLRSLPNASEWIREKARDDREQHLARAQAERDAEGSGVLRNGEG